LGDGFPELALGAPPGGVPGADPSPGPRFRLTLGTHWPWGGPGGAPGGAPGGSLGGPGGLWGVRGPLPGGYPPGGPLVAALPTDNTALLEPPPRGPPGGPFLGGPDSLGAKPSYAQFHRGLSGGPGGPPKSALGALPAGGPKKGPILGLCGCFYPSFAVDRSMSLLVFFADFGVFITTDHPLAASGGSATNWGTGSRSWPWGAPPGGRPPPPPPQKQKKKKRDLRGRN
jgi:hypothetical protein